jgi:stage V sporulation protein D (sporulation-specific penicillin-binding protein)
MAIIAQRPDNVQHRIAKAMAVITILYLCLVGRLVFLQVVSGQYYRDRAIALRAQRITLPARRGAILDRDGKPLALTTTCSVLMCDPTVVKRPQQTAELLAQWLGTPASALVPQLTPRPGPNGRPRRDVVLCPRLLPSQAIAIRAAAALRGKSELLRGVMVQDQQERVYPVGSDAVHVVGFVGDGEGGETGKLGIERAFESTLVGREGQVRAELDAHRRVIPSTQVSRTDPLDGRDIKLTIDAAAQHIAAAELAKCVAKHRPAGATVIIMEPKSGDVLALANWPSFDPITREELRKSDAGLCNRALTLYEPGSTMKVIAAAAALRAGVITPRTVFHCAGSMKIGTRVVKCASHGGGGPHAHGDITVREIIEQSCNVGAAQIGARLGMTGLRQALTDFGLLDQTRVGLPADHRGRLGFGAESVDAGSITKASRVAFGQSVVVTPLALTTAYSAIANGGALMRPRLVAAELDPSGHAAKTNAPVLVRRVLNAQQAALVGAMLRAVVTGGTGKDTQVPGYTSAGKTGTAQKVAKGSRGYSSGKYVASFIGYIPANHPRAVISVVVDEPQGGYYGAEVAGPVFREIARQLMYFWNVHPDDPASAVPTRMAAVRH